MAKEDVNKIDLSAIKLIIWDLDETFWSGTISGNKENIILNKENIQLIETLTNHGIINSICSKNNYVEIEKIFNQPELNKIRDFFVFSSINWEPKGSRINDIVTKMQLRFQNVLFIDDNVSNLEEARFYCPGIQTALPNIVGDLINQSQKLTKDDKSHSRLKQYKILEQKTEQKKNFSSNEKFLYSSNIRVEIKSDCLEHIDRIEELINRTNQLNYTKNRMKKNEIEVLLNNPDIENRYITAYDNYGDYGICGFYSYNKKEEALIHFLFSCRIMSMGVEQYIYSCLNFPDIIPNGEVAVKLAKNKYCKWINQILYKKNKQNRQNTNKNNDYKILLKGPCDMMSVVSILNSNNNEFTIDKDHFITEVDHYDEQGFRVYNSLRLVNIVNSHKLSEKTKKEILNDAKFMTKEVYNQSIFKEKYDIIVFSLLTDTSSVIYKHKKTGEIIAWDNYPDFTEEKNKEFYHTNKTILNFEYNKPNNVWSDENIKNYCQNFKNLGYMDPKKIIEYLDYLIENVPKTTKWIFIIGSDKKPKDSLYSNPHWKNIYKQRKKQVHVILNYLKKKKNITYVEISKLITSENDSTDEPDHFTRFVYYKLAVEISKSINRLLKTKAILVNYSTKICYKILVDKIYKLIITLIPCKQIKKFFKKIYVLFLITR